MGKPITVSAPDSPFAAPYFKIAEQVVQKIENMKGKQEGPKITID